MFIIDDILLSPIKSFFWIFQKIYERAKEELEDTPEKLKRELLDAQMLFETDEISEEEYQKKEVDIMARLAVLTKSEKK